MSRPYCFYCLEAECVCEDRPEECLDCSHRPDCDEVVRQVRPQERDIGDYYAACVLGELVARDIANVELLSVEGR